MNNEYYLPKIKSITIRNYDLYKCPFTIKFSEKLNVIFGTNGLGKTTLLNIIQYSIIGPYNGKLEFRNYKEQQRTKRPMHDDGFFKNRMLNENKEAEVEVCFYLGNDFYKVRHSLYEFKLLSFSVNNSIFSEGDGDYKTYEDKSRKGKDTQNYLIFKYQESLVDSSRFPTIDAYIVMLTETMFFTESRDFVFWDKNLVKSILSQYFMSYDKHLSFTKIQKLMKKYDSQTRLISYKMSMIRSFLKDDLDASASQKYELGDLQEIDNEIDILQREIEKADDKIRIIEKQKLQNRIKYEEVDKRLMEIESIWYKEIFPDEYQSMFNRYMPSLQSGTCPFCGSEHLDMKIEIEKCFFCHKPVEVQREKNLNALEIERKDKEMEKKRLSNNMKSLDEDVNKINLKRRDLQQDLNKALDKHKEIKACLDIKDNDVYAKYNKLVADKEEYYRKFKDAEKQEKVLAHEIDEEMQEVFLDYSQVFRKYASSFLGIGNKAELRLVGDREEELLEFVLNGKVRNSSSELSESQRIFVDMAFRLSILEFLNKGAYFISETPDSTLDFSFESNAIKTFSHFIDSNNTIFLSSNARNSELITQLVRKYKEEAVIVNLLKKSNLAGDMLGKVKQLDLYDFLEE